MQAEGTYGPGDPTGDPPRILVNRHTERLKKVFLIFGVIFAGNEATPSLASQHLHCAHTFTITSLRYTLQSVYIY